MTDANGEPLDPVEKRLSSIEQEVRKLRVLGEHTADDVKLVAEVQTRHAERLDEHGQMLRQISAALEPMKVVPAAVQQIARDVGFLKDFIQRVVPEHEARLGDLEKRSDARE